MPFDCFGQQVSPRQGSGIQKSFLICTTTTPPLERPYYCVALKQSGTGRRMKKSHLADTAPP